MSSAIAQAFERAAAEKNAAAFMPFVTAGYPDEDTWLELCRRLAQAGADLIEVGIPFSDPLADGPVIQATSQVALTQGVTPPMVLEMVARARQEISVPMVLMTYYNPVLNYGLEQFAQSARQAGADGVIVPDLPPEESGGWREAADAAGVDTVFLAAPTSTQDRLDVVLDVCKGFLYYVSLTGVTGSDLVVGDDVLGILALLRQASSLPVAVGFGVSQPRQAAALAQAADGVIVGSALMKTLLEADSPQAGLKAAEALAKGLAAALRRN
jgi:tryptophan synthase alpha chain